MRIFSHSGRITADMDKTNITLAFTVPQGAKSLTVHYTYSPKDVEDTDLAADLVRRGMDRYGVSDCDAECFMPVHNLVTLSFDECGAYRGACHRQPNDQTIFISDKSSTPGIINRPLMSGDWDVVLNVHFVGCTVEYNIDIDAEVEV